MKAGRMTILVGGMAIAFATLASAADSNPILVQQDKIVARPELNGPLGSGWEVRFGDWVGKSGELVVAEKPAEKHVAVLWHEVGMQSAVIDCEILFDGARIFFIGSDSGENHVGRLAVTPKNMSLRNDSTEVKGVRQGDLLDEAALDLRPGQWYRLRLEWTGDLMAAEIDGKVVKGQHPMLAKAKTRWWCGVGGAKVKIRNLTVASATTIDVAKIPGSTPVNIQTDPNQPRIEVLKEQAPNAIEWALAPLDQPIPGDIRQNLTFLREDLLDEGKQKPKGSPAAYALGSQICGDLLAVLEERNQSRIRAGFRAVEANAQTGVTSQALEARRNYQMSWPQYAREKAQRAELKSQAINNAAVMAERPKVEWGERTAGYRKTLESLYGQFRDALRQSPPAAK